MSSPCPQLPHLQAGGLEPTVTDVSFWLMDAKDPQTWFWRGVSQRDASVKRKKNSFFFTDVKGHADLQRRGWWRWQHRMEGTAEMQVRFPAASSGGESYIMCLQSAVCADWSSAGNKKWWQRDPGEPPQHSRGRSMKAGRGQGGGGRGGREVGQSLWWWRSGDGGRGGSWGGQGFIWRKEKQTGDSSAGESAAMTDSHLSRLQVRRCLACRLQRGRG